LGAALATPPPDASASKGKFKSAESRRKKRMKKNAKDFKELNLNGRPGCSQFLAVLPETAIKKSQGYN